METTTIHPAESYLRNETNPSSLYVRIAGKRRRLFINRDRGIIGIIAPGKRTKGYVFTDWSSIEQIYYPSQEQGKRLLNYILCIRFFSGMHSIVSASQFPYTNLSQGCH